MSWDLLTSQYSYSLNALHAMEAAPAFLPTPPTSIEQYVDGRGLMNNGNFSVRFVPLIAVMATVVPQLLSRIQQMRPTPTVSGRGFRDARLLIKETIDTEFCRDVKPFEFKSIPEYPDLFYSCELKVNSRNCESEVDQKHYDTHNSKYLLIGKISGSKGCFHLRLHKCPDGYEYEEKIICKMKKSEN